MNLNIGWLLVKAEGLVYRGVRVRYASRSILKLGRLLKCLVACTKRRLGCLSVASGVFS